MVDTNNTSENVEHSTTSSENDELNPLQQELENTKVKLAETHDRLLRIAADAENSRKRWEKERLDVRQYAIQDFAKDLLPVIDAFDNAMLAVENNRPNLDTEEGKRFAAVIEGIQLVSKVFYESIKKHGVERLPGQGQPFNPSYHTAVAKTVDPTVQQEIVLEEYTAGYRINERVLRAGMVRVATPE